MAYQPFGLNTVKSLLSGQGLSNIHTGSWGTPDIGLTENASSIFGTGLNQTGGSNIRNSVQASLYGPAQYNNNVKLFGVQTNPINQTSSGTSVLGATTNAGMGGSGGSGGSVPTSIFTETNDNNVGTPTYDPRNEISNSWDNYINSLNDQLNNYYPQQMQIQNQIAENAYNTGSANLNQSKATSEKQVQEQQAGSLKDIASNVQNLFNSGNNYLGARGAADSSAANQYSYAISKMGTKARGDVMSQANSRLNQIKDIYDSESRNLESERTNSLLQISQWFTEAQQVMRQQLAQAGLNKSQDLQAASTNLYNQALSLLQQKQGEIASRKQQLEQWALNNSKTIEEAVGNMRTLSQLPEYQGINGGMPTVNAEGQPNLFGYGSGTTEDKNKLFV